MKPLIFGIVSGLIVSTLSQSITNPPSASTVAVGQHVTMTCEVSGDNGVLTWTEYASRSTGRKIWVSGTGFFNPEDEQKYEIVGNYNLRIKDAQMSDGGSYGCTLANLQEIYSAPLVVLEQPQLVIPNLEQNKQANIRCNGYFKGTLSLEDLDELHIPKLKLYLDGNLVVTDEEVPEYNGQRYYSNLNYTYTGRASDNGKNMTCALETQSPQGRAVTIEKADVKFPVANVYAPENDEYSVGQNITCTADGNPTPDIRWEYVDGPGRGSPNGAVLRIVQDMIGANTWTCIASNTVNDLQTDEITVDFNVVAAIDPTSLPTTEGTPAWVIAVAVIIPLLVVVGIGVLVFVLLRRSQNNSGKETKTPPASNPGYESEAPVVTSDPSINTNLQKAPPVGNNNMYNNGGRTTPTIDAPAQYPGKNSPGYADLGVKQIGKVSKNPDPSRNPYDNRGYNPNRSADSSFASDTAV